MVAISRLRGDLAFGASDLALLTRGIRGVSRAFSDIVVVSGESASGGGLGKLLGQAAPHDSRVLGVFVARV